MLNGTDSYIYTVVANIRARNSLDIVLNIYLQGLEERRATRLYASDHRLYILKNMYLIQARSHDFCVGDRFRPKVGPFFPLLFRQPV